jgi:hypothetical protein
MRPHIKALIDENPQYERVLGPLVPDCSELPPAVLQVAAAILLALHTAYAKAAEYPTLHDEEAHKCLYSHIHADAYAALREALEQLQLARGQLEGDAATQAQEVYIFAAYRLLSRAREEFFMLNCAELKDDEAAKYQAAHSPKHFSWYLAGWAIHKVLKHYEKMGERGALQVLLLKALLQAVEELLIGNVDKDEPLLYVLSRQEYGGLKIARREVMQWFQNV